MLRLPKNLSSPFVLAFVLSLFIATPSFAKPRRSVAQLRSGNTTVSKPLKVTGQTRTLSMMLVLKNKKEKSNFISPREHYRGEILTTRY
jgi:hypothetical protein